MRKTKNKNLITTIARKQNTIKKHKEMLNFKRIWLLSFLLTSGFAIIPVIFFAVIDYNVTQRLTLSETISRTARLTSNSWRSVSFFLNERQSALKYVVEENNYQDLNDPVRLSNILENLRNSFDGFTDLGVINSEGFQQTYAGPYQLKGKNYSGQKWFENVVSHGKYISNVFLGFRNVPHLVIAIKQESADGKFYVLRASIEHKLDRILSEVNTSIYQTSSDDSRRNTDVFLINHIGVLQTESSRFGKVLDIISIPVPGFSDKTEVIESQNLKSTNLVIGYRYIPETPFILVIAKDKGHLMIPWRESRVELLQYLAVSITIGILWILCITTYLIKRLKETDRCRVQYLHMAEYSNNLASIGRLASGVAHEINNPLAIINEKAGLVKDIFHFQKKYQEDAKLLNSMDAILNSVERCSRITRRLLSFARHMDVSVQQIKFDDLIEEVLSFLIKEAEYRSINIVVKIHENIPDIESDRGKLQQIFLNIINNALASMTTGGTVQIEAKAKKDHIHINISDTGCGIAKENMEYIFEPFFSTKTEVGGTGLGLSITYSLVQELGGWIEVDSTVGKGTIFTIILPIKLEKKDEENACTAG